MRSTNIGTGRVLDGPVVVRIGLLVVELGHTLNHPKSGEPAEFPV